MTTSASWCSPTPAAPAAPTMRISAPGISGFASITCSKPAGAPTPPSRGSAARTAPTRRSRRCFGTNVKGEKRFLSTIARRLDTLGAITKGQRQTGGQGLFRADDNLESHYARDALRQFYMLLFPGKVAACSLGEFQDATGLALTDEGGLRDELPPITTFLNRILALPIALQNAIFEVFEQRLEARIEGAIAAGIYDKGLETITANR
jgi:C-terminal domain on Strawberry notch homologue